MIITWGGRQSNHCRQTAAAAARLGLRCILVLTRGALEDQDYQHSGNMLLDQLLGAETLELERDADAATRAADTAEQLRRTGERPYVIPLGGSTARGALGYVRCAEEILAVDQTFSAVFLATGSGGTQAGLVAGLRINDSPLPVIGVSVGVFAETLVNTVHSLAEQTAELLGANDAQVPILEDILIDDRQIGPGYGDPTPETHAAIHLAATTEGMLLDPVYTGKAMAGLLQAIRNPDNAPTIGSDVLFLHTGGQAGLFAYRQPLTEWTAPRQRIS